MIRLFSAAFTPRYLRPAVGLIKSARQYSPQVHLTVFTDLPEFEGQDFAVHADLGEVISELDAYHQQEAGQRQTAFKVALFRRMKAMFPDSDMCWIDADALVLGDLSEHLIPGKINVMSHGRRDGQELMLGNGLVVDGSRYAIGGFFSLPAGTAVDRFFDFMCQRHEWTDLTPLVRDAGDQVILNHLVARSGLQVHWLSDDRRYVFNLEVGENVHPVVGDPGLKAIGMRDGIVSRDDRRIIVFPWIMNRFEDHVRDGFNTFQPELRDYLLSLYGAEDQVPLL